MLFASPQSSFIILTIWLGACKLVMTIQSTQSQSPRPPCFWNAGVFQLLTSNTIETTFFLIGQEWTNGQLGFYFRSCPPKIYKMGDLEAILSIRNLSIRNHRKVQINRNALFHRRSRTYRLGLRNTIQLFQSSSRRHLHCHWFLLRWKWSGNVLWGGETGVCIL